jgi:hypothetical protein
MFYLRNNWFFLCGILAIYWNIRYIIPYYLNTKLLSDQGVRPAMCLIDDGLTEEGGPGRSKNDTKTQSLGSTPVSA